ncbi:Carboxylesterase, type B [Kalmanozyma brasiliensis GHG001]|uniref:Carboxylic ester hydrolase n=1 Tax=Kalmanozyma brasiliensis (strain GHG001) TaxID=1365824 RepID=V5EGW9_KALBG|nr:Carboxylesterase, type B [Kalmanozyma brasiliensis GHG001]EST09801.1 Carboxylesterase, type B [Kalmanozyma brasiliensis GHG001]
MRLSPLNLVAAAAAAVGLVSALPSVAPQPRGADCQPTVKLHQGTVRGIVDANYGLEQFFGIPYAKAPINNLRFAKPQPVDGHPGSTIDATRFGDICMQPAAPSPLYNMSEDCLNINVVRPVGTTEHAKLPVLTWIYGGAFFVGSTPAYNASELVQRSVDIGKPIVFVAMNYRVGPFGFIGGSEVADSEGATSNAGLYDQRLAMKWVKKNIGKFGGDAGRVTLFGESAGAMSVALNNFAYDGDNEGLWHAAIMDSGGIAPGPLLTPKHPAVEKSFESLAAGVGCTGGNGTLLKCLRAANANDVLEVSFALTGQAGGTFPIAGALAWLPLVDYELITNYPSVNLPQGKLADIPVIAGNNLDEGPLFAQQHLNSSSNFETWVRSAAVIYNTSYTEQALQRVFSAYPDIPSLGSPYYNAETTTSAGTTNLTSRVYPPSTGNQYKRSAAFFGDFTFQAHRRTYLRAATAGKKNGKNVWSFEFQQNDKFANGTGSPLGAYHGSELKYFFVLPDGRIKDPVLEDKMPRAYISFTYYHDPTVLSGLDWPRYREGGELLQLKGGNVTRIKDTYRKEAMEALTNERSAKVFGF